MKATARAFSCSHALRGCALLVGVSLGLGGCLVGDHKCSKNQVPSAGDFNSCDCAPGHIFAADGFSCVPCGANEKVNSGVCVCEDGFRRNPASMLCEQIEGSAIGTPCSAENPCADPNPYCATAEAAPFCTTSGCTKNDDCERNYRCVTPASGPSYCGNQPSGIGMMCKTDADCAGKEASYCLPVSPNSCLVTDCAPNPSKCPSHWVCCDLRGFTGHTLCVEDIALREGGLCPDGKMPVTQ